MRNASTFFFCQSFNRCHFSALESGVSNSLAGKSISVIFSSHVTLSLWHICNLFSCRWTDFTYSILLYFLQSQRAILPSYKTFIRFHVHVILCRLPRSFFRWWQIYHKNANIGMIRQDKVQRIERIQWTLEKEDHATIEVLVVKGLMGIYTA